MCRIPENISDENKFQIKSDFLEKETKAELKRKQKLFPQERKMEKYEFPIKWKNPNWNAMYQRNPLMLSSSKNKFQIKSNFLDTKAEFKMKTEFQI